MDLFEDLGGCVTIAIIAFIVLLLIICVVAVVLGYGVSELTG